MSRPVNIKGTRHGLIISFDSNAEFEEIKEYLSKKMASARGFFKGAKFALHSTHNCITENQKKELENICLQYGLVKADNVIELADYYNKIKKNNNESKKANITPLKEQEEKTLLIKRTLRSGHSIEFDGHVVVIGSVHAGAEVIAKGNIIVIGFCMGTVHAGALGNKKSIVISSKLCPVQLRIANLLATSPNNTKPLHPEIAKIVDDKIIVEKLNFNKTLFENYIKQR
jgi:septum site-determining protein MinC